MIQDEWIIGIVHNFIFVSSFIGPSIGERDRCFVFRVFHGKERRNERNGSVVRWPEVSGGFGSDLRHPEVWPCPILPIWRDWRSSRRHPQEGRGWHDPWVGRRSTVYYHNFQVIKSPQWNIDWTGTLGTMFQALYCTTVMFTSHKTLHMLIYAWAVIWASKSTFYL